MQWFFAAIMLAFLAWALFRAYQSAMFNRLMALLEGEPTDAKVRQFIDQLQDRQLPNARQFLDRLGALDKKVARSSRVSTDLKDELHTLLTVKGVSD